MADVGRISTMLVWRGAAAVLFGVVTLIWPDVTLGALVVMFGAYALLDGLVAVATALGGGDAVVGRRGWLAGEGILGIIAGLGALLWPGVTASSRSWLRWTTPCESTATPRRVPRRG